MSTTSIEWTDDTWNPVRGCARVSPGCEHCYAERQAHRFSGVGQPYEGLTVLGKKGPRWAGRARFVPEMLDAPLRWRKPRRVFVNSMSDLFHEDIANEEIAAVFGVMAAASRHTFQVLTKRPERMREWFAWVSAQPNQPCGEDFTVQQLAWERLDNDGRRRLLHPIKGTIKAWPWPLPNVWLGVSCEDQQRADERIPLLLDCPAAIRFVSAEPLLGPLNLRPYMGLECIHEDAYVEPDTNAVICRECNDAAHLDWVIVGGESGPGARPCEADWIKAIIAQCADAGVACFVKQLGAMVGWTIDLAALRAGGPVELGPRLTHRKGGDPNEWPTCLRVRQFPETRHA